MKHNAARVAAAYLRELGVRSISYGDALALHEVAERLGMPHRAWLTERKVLNRIDRTHRGVFEKRYMSFPEVGMGKCRSFVLIDGPQDVSALHGEEK